MKQLTEQLFLAFANGLFPMVSEAHGLTWEMPPTRAIIDVKSFKPSRNLERGTKQFEIRKNTNFAQVMVLCAAPSLKRSETWLVPELQSAYQELYDMGLGESVEAWLDDELVGGVFAIRIGNYYTAESMFSLTKNASKAALIALINDLKTQNVTFIDVQYLTEHLQRFGAFEIPHRDFLSMHKKALVSFHPNINGG